MVDQNAQQLTGGYTFAPVNVDGLHLILMLDSFVFVILCIGWCNDGDFTKHVTRRFHFPNLLLAHSMEQQTLPSRRQSSHDFVTFVFLFDNSFARNNALSDVSQTSQFFADNVQIL